MKQFVTGSPGASLLKQQVFSSLSCMRCALLASLVLTDQRGSFFAIYSLNIEDASIFFFRREEDVV